MNEIREPHITIEGGRAKVQCSTTGCGRKLLGEIAPETRIAAGWVSYFCPRCKVTYRLTPNQPEPMPLAS